MLDNISIDNLMEIKDYKSNFDRNKPCKFLDVNMIPVDIFNDKLFKKALKKMIDMFYDSLNWTLIDKENTIDRFF